MKDETAGGQFQSIWTQHKKIQRKNNFSSFVNHVAKFLNKTIGNFNVR